MLLQITHETHYRYSPAVETAQHVAYLQPCKHSAQNLLSHSLVISPLPEQQRNMPDVYGNVRCFFSLQVPHEELSVVASSLISTQTTATPTSALAWEQVRERFRYQAGAQFDAAAEFVFTSPFVPRHADFLAYALPSFAAGATLLACAIDLMQRIHTDFIYESQSTQINTPALEALAQRKGVCQDFAHIMLACYGLACALCERLFADRTPTRHRQTGGQRRIARLGERVCARPTRRRALVRL
jgi:transglutaminase-like putative cysteine protease